MEDDEIVRTLGGKLAQYGRGNRTQGDTRRATHTKIVHNDALIALQGDAIEEGLGRGVRDGIDDFMHGRMALGEGLELTVATDYIIDKGIAIHLRGHSHTILRPKEEGGFLPVVQVLARLGALIDKRGSVAVDGEIALGDALHLRIERALHHFVFSQALEGMTDGLTEAIDLTGTIDPPHAIATKLRL